MGVSKSSGGYFFNEPRVWTEALQTGIEPAWSGSFNGTIELPEKPNPDIMKGLALGHDYIPHIQSNRVGVFQIGHDWSKSVSLWAYGMTEPKDWGSKTKVFDAILRKEVERFLCSQMVNGSAQGKEKIPSQGIAAHFHHWRSSAGVIHAHSHSAIPNVSVTADGKTGSIANAHVLFDQQGELRARCNKSMDEVLQAEGLATRRNGSAVELANVPEKLLCELSPAKEAMDRAKAEKGFDSAKAAEFFARQARREVGENRDVTPDQAYAKCQELLQAHGLKPDDLKRTDSPNSPPSAVAEQHVAFEVAVEAIKEAGKQYGVFTWTQYNEQLFTLGIGKQVSSAALDTMGNTIARDPEKFGLKVMYIEGKVLYATKESLNLLREVEREYIRPDVSQAWSEFKKAAVLLKDAVTVATIRKGTEILNRLREWVDPEPKVVRITGLDLGQFVEKHHRTSLVAAHAVALIKGLNAPGNPHEKAAHAEKVFSALRAFERVPRRTVLVVEDAYKATPRELRDLARIQKRDRVAVVLCQRPDPGEGQEKEREAHKDKSAERPKERQKEKSYAPGL